MALTFVDGTDIYTYPIDWDMTITTLCELMKDHKVNAHSVASDFSDSSFSSRHDQVSSFVNDTQRDSKRPVHYFRKWNVIRPFSFSPLSVSLCWWMIKVAAYRHRHCVYFFRVIARLGFPIKRYGGPIPIIFGYHFWCEICYIRYHRCFKWEMDLRTSSGTYQNVLKWSWLVL